MKVTPNHETDNEQIRKAKEIFEGTYKNPPLIRNLYISTNWGKGYSAYLLDGEFKQKLEARKEYQTGMDDLSIPRWQGLLDSCLKQYRKDVEDLYREYCEQDIKITKEIYDMELRRLPNEAKQYGYKCPICGTPFSEMTGHQFMVEYRNGGFKCYACNTCILKLSDMCTTDDTRDWLKATAGENKEVSFEIGDFVYSSTLKIIGPVVDVFKTQIRVRTPKGDYVTSFASDWKLCMSKADIDQGDKSKKRRFKVGDEVISLVSGKIGNVVGYKDLADCTDGKERVIVKTTFSNSEVFGPEENWQLVGRIDKNKRLFSEALQAEINTAMFESPFASATSYKIPRNFVLRCIDKYPNAQLYIMQDCCGTLIKVCDELADNKFTPVDNLKKAVSNVLISLAVLSEQYHITGADVEQAIKNLSDIWDAEEKNNDK